MGRFLPYQPDQAYLVPPSVKDELGEDHLCFFIHQAVEHMDLKSFEQVYGEEGGALYCPALMLKVWLYAYAVGITSARRLEQRIREDLGLRYLAGGARPDNWALSAFRRRHGRGLNDVFTQVLEMARAMKLGRLGQVAIDSTRIQAAASRNRLETEERLRQERARLRRSIRRWQKLCDQDDPNEGPGTRVALENLQEQLQAMPRRLEKLRKSGMEKVSRTDEEARFLRERSGFVLGYTAEAAVNEDHLIVGQRVTQNAADNHSLIPMVEEAERQSGAKAEKILADAGFFSLENIEQLESRGLEVYLPDSNLARELNTGQRCPRIRLSPTQRRMRQKLRGPTGQAIYRRRKALVEPVWGTLKEQRGMRRFRLRGLEKVNIEFTLAAISFNLTRLLANRLSGPKPLPHPAIRPPLTAVLTRSLKPASQCSPNAALKRRSSTVLHPSVAVPAALYFGQQYLFLVSIYSVSTRTPNHRSPAIRAKAAVTVRAVSHPMCWASHGVRTGEIAPPILLPKFIVPPAMPLCSPESCAMVAQNGPSVQITNTVQTVRAATARMAFGVRAPTTRKIAEMHNAARGRLRRPQVAPHRTTAKSENTPPNGIAKIVAIQGSAVKLAAFKTSRCRTCTR